MNAAELIEQMSALVSTELAMMGFELIDIDFSGNTLRLTIDKPSGVSLDDCVAVNRRVGFLLDVQDPIEGSYRLEISSPGLNRKLKSAKEFEHFSGRKVKVQTKEGIYRGIIKDLMGDVVILDVDGVEIQLAQKDIIKANLDF
jgi:ribosome maturation factor RimP